MDIKLDIKNKKYIRDFNSRKQKIDNWYRDFDNNFNKVLDEIENRNPNV
jgi:hypothetical protein